MPNEVLNKIKYLCKEIPKVEWSGILLYEVKGSIKQPTKMEIILRDIIPMNKGTQAYTEYQFNEKKRDSSGYADRHIDYIEENEHALEWHLGHVHSHNTMGVFFSGTDMAELDDNSASHNFYLSLIVNNFMDFTAKVAFRAEASSEIAMPYIALDENGTKYTIDESKFVVKKEKLFMYDCDIHHKSEKIKVDDYFANNVNDIIVEADKPKQSFTTYPATPATSYKPNTPVSNIPVSNPTAVKKVEQKPSEIVKGFIKDIPFDELDELFPRDEPEDIEIFIMALLGGGNKVDDTCENLVDTLEYLATFDVSADDVCQSIVDNYGPLYEKYFEKNVENPDFFVALTEDVISILEDYEGEYEFLSKSIISLKYILKKFEEYESAV